MHKSLKDQYRYCYTRIYCDGGSWYVRLCPIETKDFGHGLGLSTKFKEKERAEAFRDRVEGYLKAWLGDLYEKDLKEWLNAVSEE